jgi:uncharacterized protein (DUF58 family)
MTEALGSFIDEDFLKNLEKLKLVTKRGVKGPHRGEHKSWLRGEGIEFLDYRRYHLGDDLRYVDWSVYGRLDKLFIKLFHLEENQTVTLILDMSRSMASGSPPKHISAKKIAAALSYICLSNLDKIGLTSFSDGIRDTKPPTRGKKSYPEILSFLVSLKPQDKTDINASLLACASTIRRQGIAVIISDLFDPKGCSTGLKALAYNHFDTHIIQTLDHEELFWSKTGNFILTEVETGERKVTFVDRSLSERYREKINAFIREIRNLCGKYGISHYLYDTRIPFEEFLVDYFTKDTIGKCNY